METILIITKKEMFSDSSRNYIRNKVRKFKKIKKKTNNAYLMSQNHHQILENDRLPMEREREMVKKKKYKVIKSIKRKKNQASISNH